MRPELRDINTGQMDNRLCVNCNLFVNAKGQFGLSLKNRYEGVRGKEMDSILRVLNRIALNGGKDQEMTEPVNLLPFLKNCQQVTGV